MNYEGWQAELPQEAAGEEQEQTEREAASTAKEEEEEGGSQSHVPESLDNEEEKPAFSGHDGSANTAQQHSFTIPQVTVDDESAA